MSNPEKKKCAAISSLNSWAHCVLDQEIVFRNDLNIPKTRCRLGKIDKEVIEGDRNKSAVWGRTREMEHLSMSRLIALISCVPVLLLCEAARVGFHLLSHLPPLLPFLRRWEGVAKRYCYKRRNYLSRFWRSLSQPGTLSCVPTSSNWALVIYGLHSFFGAVNFTFSASTWSMT